MVSPSTANVIKLCEQVLVICKQVGVVPPDHSARLDHGNQSLGVPWKFYRVDADGETHPFPGTLDGAGSLGMTRDQAWHALAVMLAAYTEVSKIPRHVAPF